MSSVLLTAGVDFYCFAIFLHLYFVLYDMGGKIRMLGLLVDIRRTIVVC